ncbi:hypothetical protein N7462_008211 [Penicillium macrosclerotiorum]|uniref:uncharacterized protein n=1 Tax=Penicillium macrosclerotiorum TaxID=303699 RepID=UPI00254672F8|nr:uncharacterized protein N7462_008211 [Penicillium macrosclerotiorum]KAJ5679967.1 hypothetical protein N7462_008211 [Penicillium macrosclerotiorum]
MEELILFMVWISVVGMILSLYSTSSWFGAVICRQDLSKSTKGDIHYASWWQRRWSFPSKQAHLSRSDHSLFEANLPTGLFGKKKVYLSQLPLKDAAPKGAWLTLLSVIHPTPSNGNCQIMPGRQAETWSKCSLGDKHTERQPEKTPKNSWPDVANHGLYQHKAAPEIVISRTTFMALLCLTNSRPVVHHSSASGHRAAYPSYCGQWRVEWPIGDRARVYFFEHDLYPSSKALYPPTFEQRVDKCLQMLAGVIDSQTSSFKCAFSGRKSPGKYLLEYGPKGFGAVHSGRHLYHMMGEM